MHLPKDRKGWAKVLLAIAGLVVAYFLYKEFFPELEPQALLDDISSALGQWTYLLVGAFAFLETGAFVGLVAPGETMVVLGGAVAGQGETNVILTIAIVWSGAFLGDTASFMLGRKLGRGWVEEHGHRLRITPERFKQVEAYFERHGGKTILIGRFIGLVRALAPFIAGTSGMGYRAMAPFSILGTGLWATFFTLLGYYAAKNLDAVFHAVERGFFWFAVFVGLIVGIVIAVRFLRVPANRAKAVREMEQRRLTRPLVAFGRRLRPQARFLWNRITPGNLGLELTAPFAALAVGAFVFFGYAIILGEDPGPTAGDTTAMDIVDTIRAAWLTDIAKVITWLGSGMAVTLVALAAALAFAVRRHFTEMWILIGAMVILLIAVPEAKDVIDRPRPPGSLVATADAAYPSGHAAYSIIYSWLAMAATLRLRPGWSGGTALMTAGLVVTALVGLSRVYLGAHYMSDVNGGWALGVCAFAVVTLISVLVAYGQLMRQNRADVS
jgi:membrane protein DedA with SNARE-associated domain/membrane-associated phospholipid phosphatase